MNARVLIVNNDDFGIYPEANRAVIDSIDHGISSSCSLMVPCPGAPEALRLLAERPDIAFGIHLTLVADFPTRRWDPLAGKENVTSLLDHSGQLFTSETKAALVAAARIDEVELEFRAQIQPVFEAGLTPTHLDWHCLADGGREDGRSARYAHLLRNLPPGLSEWAVHPSFENPLDGGSRIRRTDYDFLVSPEAREIIEQEEITVIDYRRMLA